MSNINQSALPEASLTLRLISLVEASCCSTAEAMPSVARFTSSMVAAMARIDSTASAVDACISEI